MQTIIRYPNAQRVEALVLALGPYSMRLLPRGAEDAIALRRRYGQWTDESGVPVEFESFVAGAGIDIGGLLETAQLGAAAS